MLDCDQEVLVRQLRLFVAGGAEAGLTNKTLALLDGVVKLRIGVAELKATCKDLEPFHVSRRVRLALRQRRDLDRIVEQKGRLNELWLDVCAYDLVEELSPAGARLGPDIHPSHLLLQLIE